MKGFYKGIHSVIHALMGGWTRRHWSGMENLPKDGGFIVVPNHISNVDPLCVFDFLGAQGYPVRIMAKKQLFKVPVLGWALRKLKMVSVDRESTHKDGVLAGALAALRQGECIAIYAEGTLTRDPQYWPMKTKTGAARLALDAGVPLIPLAQWGAQDIMPRYTKRIDIRPNRDVWIAVQPAVDLEGIDTSEGSANWDAVDELNRRLEKAMMAGVEELRGGEGPDEPWDPAKMNGPDKKTLGRFAKWRKSIRKRAKKEN